MFVEYQGDTTAKKRIRVSFVETSKTNHARTQRCVDVTFNWNIEYHLTLEALMWQCLETMTWTTTKNL